MPSKYLRIMDPIVKKMLENIEQKTGKSADYWIKLVKKSGLAKHGEKMKLLKEDHGFTHGYANTIVHLAKEDSAVNTENKDELVDAQYKGKESLEPIYAKLIKAISKFGTDVEIAPKKSYVSLRRNKQFALIQPSTKTRVDIGVNLKEVKPSGVAEKAGSWNSMVTHRIRIENAKEVNKEVINWLKEAYKNA